MSVGIDIVQVSRLIDNQESISEKILSRSEYELYSKRIDKLEFLAGRFAVKEAFLKANSLGLFDINIKDIEVLNEENGKPYILYKTLKYTNVSISHEKEYAVAIVIL